jgi:hypothetical protein
LPSESESVPVFPPASTSPFRPLHAPSACFSRLDSTQLPFSSSRSQEHSPSSSPAPPPPPLPLRPPRTLQPRLLLPRTEEARVKGTEPALAVRVLPQCLSRRVTRLVSEALERKTRLVLTGVAERSLDRSSEFLKFSTLADLDLPSRCHPAIRRYPDEQWRPSPGDL